jgi:hypothetical protein
MIAIMSPFRVIFNLFLAPALALDLGPEMGFGPGDKQNSRSVLRPSSIQFTSLPRVSWQGYEFNC